MFNKVYDNVFYYLKHPKIIMDMNEAVIKEDKLNILAPEIILLYKSRNYTNCDYQHDFDVVINKLEKDRYDWFINAMNIAYPKGHPWIKEIA